MSDIIQLLPDSVANQIAAGEVIQRPASVVKELVENAIDAGATDISVNIVDAGRTSIQVIDNGKGMSDTDARLSFERHATSKIRRADDLFALRTMGFRGEALASIAAVAQVELKTRTEEAELGTHISLAGSRVSGQEPTACPKGSNFMVENLFFNVPARRKFLKSNATELTNIVATMERMVLVYPNISFTLRSNGTELMTLRPGNTHQRIADVMGKKLSQDLLPIDVDTTLCRISGFVGKPEAARKKCPHQYFFVNGRYMRHPYFHKAVADAFERLVPQGMQVPYFVYFDIAPESIDVNIHPTKTEIKFDDEQAVWQILNAAVKDAIGKFCDVPTIDFDTEGKPEIPVFNPSSEASMPQPTYNPAYNPFNSSTGRAAKAPNDWQKLYEQPAEQPDGQDLFATNEGGSATLIEDKSPAHYQYKGRYIMTAVKSGLMIIDQRRADIRIRFEQFMASIASHAAATQRVLFPETVQLAPSADVALQSIMPQIEAMGFSLSPLGDNAYAINGVPAGIDGAEPAALLNAIIADAADNPAKSSADIAQAIALSMARNTALAPGQVLQNDEMESIVNQLFACSNVNYTPDGKAIICILPQRDIEQLLG